MTTITRTADLKVGDRITEIDTPEGPFYEVLQVIIKAKSASLIVETATAGELADGESYPLTLRITSRSAVLVDGSQVRGQLQDALREELRTWDANLNAATSLADAVLPIVAAVLVADDSHEVGCKCADCAFWCDGNQ
ncbi:MAG TPA: hypothetical protein VIJ96_01675 [Acidothermaceae bacterium]